jgi:hypothetical protein
MPTAWQILLNSRRSAVDISLAAGLMILHSFNVARDVSAALSATFEGRIGAEKKLNWAW